MLPQVIRGFADVVFPPVCVHCRALVERDAGEDASAFRHLCRNCVNLLDHVKPPHCSTCGHPFFGLVEGERMCPKCEGLDPAFREEVEQLRLSIRNWPIEGLSAGLRPMPAPEASSPAS